MSVPSTTWQDKYTEWKRRLDQLATSPTSTDTQRSTAKQSYKTLMEEIVVYMKENSESMGASSHLQKIGALQQSIAQLYKEKDSMKHDVESAIARDEALRSRDIPTNPHALYLLNRPIRRAMIPYLWALSILFIGITITIYYMVGVRMEIFGTASGYAIANSPQTAAQKLQALFDLLTSRTFLLGYLAASILTILILALKMGGVF